MTPPAVTLADLRPGDIMFARHVTPRAVDLLILAGQLFLGQPGYPHHVAVVTRASEYTEDRETGTGWWHGPQIVQAMPSGAEEIMIGAEHWTRDYIYVRPRYADATPHYSQGEHVAEAARSYKGTPYSFADYAALTGLHLGIEDGPVRRYVRTSKHMICSQLADQALSDAGFHVFKDARLPQDVTPSALFEKLLSLSGGSYVIAGDRAAWAPTGAALRITG